MVLHRLIVIAVKETVRDIVVPVVCAGLAAWAVVKASEIANRPKSPEPKGPDQK